VFVRGLRLLFRIIYDFLLRPMKKLRYLKSMHDPFLTDIITGLLLQIISLEI